MSRFGLLLDRNFRLLWQGQLVSLLGTQVFRLALVVWLKDAADSATLLGLLMAAFVVPGLVIGPIGGVLVDRYPRRLVMIACDLVQGTAVLALAVLWLVLPPSHPASIVGLFVLAVIGGSTTAVFQPAAISIVPELVARERLPRANSFIQGTFQVGSLVAQSMSGISFRIVGAPVLAVLDAMTYFYSAACAFLIKTPRGDEATHRERPRPAVPAGEKRSFVRELRAAMTYVRSATGLLVLILLAASLRFFVAPFTVLFAFYVDGQLHASPDWYGFLIGGIGVGTIAGVVLSGAVTLTPRTGATAIVAAFIVQSLALTSLAVVATPYAALALVTLSGVLSGFINVRLTTLLQLAVVPEMRGRVFGVLRTILEALVPVATILAGVAADLTGRNVALVYAACGLALTCVSVTIAASRSCRAFLTGAATVPAPARPVAAPAAEPAVTAGVGS